MTTAQNLRLDNTQPGDELILVSGRSTRIVAVTRRTKARVFVSLGHRENEHRLDDGAGVARHDRSYVRLPEPGEVEAIRERVAAEEKEAKERRAAEREAMKGTVMGELVAAEEALQPWLEANKGAATEKLGQRFLAVIWQIKFDLPHVERDMRRTADALRASADRIDQAIDNRWEGEPSLNHQAFCEAAGQAATRRRLMHEAHEVVGHVAALLGVEEEALVAPMAKTAE